MQISVSFSHSFIKYNNQSLYWMSFLVQSATAIEYTGCFSTTGEDPPTIVLDMKLNKVYGKVPVMLELWGKFYGKDPVMFELWVMEITLLLPSLPGPVWPRVVALDRILSIGQIELKCVIIQNRFPWNKNVLTFKLRTYAKLSCLEWNRFRHWIGTYAKLNCLE